MALACVAPVTAAPLCAQEFEPKAYSVSPVGATFLVRSVARSTGSVVFDETWPIADVSAGVNAAFLGVGSTLGLFGTFALGSAAFPYAWGHVSRNVFEEARTVRRSGMADARLRLSVNLRGNEAMRIAEFARAPRRTMVRRRRPESAMGHRRRRQFVLRNRSRLPATSRRPRARASSGCACRSSRSAEPPPARLRAEVKPGAHGVRNSAKDAPAMDLDAFVPRVTAMLVARAARLELEWVMPIG